MCSEMNKGRSHGLPIDSLGNAAGSSNWQEFVDDRGIYTQPQEVQNYNRTFHDCSNVNRQIGLPAVGSNSSGDRNSKFASTDNGSSSFWRELISLTEAPSAASGNFMVNSSIGAKNDHIQDMKAQYAVQQSRTTDNVNVVAGRVMLSSDSRGCSLRIEDRSSGVNGYVTPGVYSQEIGHQMQPNVTTSVPLNQSYHTASNHREKNTSLSHTMQHRIPVHYQPRDNLNCTDAKAASGINSTSQLAPLTPQPNKRSHQHSTTMDTALDQDLNHDKVSKDDFAASRITYPSQLAPVTPQLSKEVNHHRWQATQRDQIRNQETVQKEYVGGFTGDEFVTQGSQQIIDPDPPSAAHGTPLKERLDNEETQDIDLNKTPPKKAPRRKKHRPRVIVENKRPRKRRPAKAKLGPDGLPMPKRKYVRKSKCDPEKSLQVDARETKKECTPKPASKPCKRSLNLELQDDIIETTNLVEQQETQNQSHSLMKGYQTEKPYMSNSNEAERATELRKTTANGYHIPAYQPLDAGASQPCFQETLKSRQILQMIVQERQQMASEYIRSRASKRAFGLSKELRGVGPPTKLISSQLLCKKIFQNGQNNTNNMPCQYYTGTHKRKEVEYLRHTTSSSSQYSVKVAKKSTSEAQTNGYPLLEANGGLFKQYHNNVSGKSKGGLCYSSSELNACPASPFTNPLRWPISLKGSLQQEKAAEKEDQASTLHVLNSLNGQACASMLLQAPPNETRLRTQSPTVETTNGINHAIAPAKKHTSKRGNPYMEKIFLSKVAINSYEGSCVKQKSTVPVDDIIEQLERLNLNSTIGEMLKDEQKALVLYKGDGRIIPYEGFDLLKRRKARPRVDLDPETDRLWKLLMGKEVQDDEKQTDEQKAKWWEEQRDIFRGRADSFIARMHLIQGDRRFSAWKGSVVDSVIGVFLTQNVTDHLSSSAFMSLAARFRPRNILWSIASGDKKPDGLVEDVDISVLDTNNNTQRHEKFTTRADNNRIRGEPPSRQMQKVTSADCAEQAVKANWRLDDAIPMRYPTNFSVQTTGAAQSLFTSDSETDCKASVNQSSDRYTTMPSIIEEIENLIRVPNFTSQEYEGPSDEIAKNVFVQLHNAENSNNNKQLDRVHFNGLIPVNHPFDHNRSELQDQDISSSILRFPAARGLRLSETGGFYMPKKQHTMSSHSASDGNTQTAVQNYNHQSPCHNHLQDGNMNTQFGSKSDKESLYSQKKMEEDQTANKLPGHTFSTRKNISEAENGVQSQNKANFKKQDFYSTEASRKNVSKEKGGKEEGGKMTVDWDSLRRQVKTNRKSKERNQDTRDSMDYEALRLADVGEISKAIKERGMNNLLADRMKDFLNRLVRDHGSIDLEWLRDAPPDKAKDYLLSIRGLGLKSVECIRLLTLHQHAFPVDTNVGRIAVRLGWVPLQPLPESLQLHLLEMYPVLETIQKYLWPRLCNLDQRTLYELHYQLITFGKVFCTKSKPNCNACPMRGECRHFASAFASSRLALPGPDERNAVTSSIPSKTKNPDVTVSAIPLHSLLEEPPEEATSVHRTYEPIVEEPATPEPESPEMSETDIEEAFFEDPDEIPTIRLNVEEFTQNLQDFMQENMELQKEDMSKALVTLNPKFASIPTPKLKNISRLRTEHHVYELPDSHTLLKKFDKREPDDPSPYLLAIWSPGETAHSIQRPEEMCSFQENGELCSQKTCIACNRIRESNSETVRGTLLIPCRTATRGSFPLNGTYFQVNEVFADHESSLNPIDVPRAWIWNLPKRTVYFGTSVTTIFRGMSTEDIQYCFWRGYVCVRGFEQKTRTPRPLMARLHFPASKQVRQKRNEIRQTGTALPTSNSNNN